MLTPPPVKYPRRRRRRLRPRSSPPPAALTLASAIETEGVLTLAFDRAIDIGALDGSQIIVDDGAITGTQWQAVGAATLIDPATVEIGLVEVGPWAGPDMRLSATAGTGIVAADDGGTWAGVSDLELPFP